MKRIRRRHGFTLNEIIISMFILGIIGVAFTKLLTVQNRFFDTEQNRKAARSIARNSMNLVLSDLRMVQDSGGVDSASTDGKTIRVFVPYRYGLYCGNWSGKTTVSMLPTDSAALGLATYAGYAYRDSSTGRYVMITPGAPTGGDAPVTSATVANCTGSGAGQAQIKTVSVNGRTGNVLDIKPQMPTYKTGTPVFFWQKVTYSFAASTVFPGFYSLWRTVLNGRSDELLGPYDSTARFRFYQTGDDTSRTTVPSLYLIRGLDVVLPANSPNTSVGRTNEKTTLVTSVFFKNVRQF